MLIGSEGNACNAALRAIIGLIGMTALRFLKAHPLAMQAYFEHVLVLTYALPETKLQPLLPRGLVLDTYEGYGFLAIAMVQTRNMALQSQGIAVGDKLRSFFWGDFFAGVGCRTT